MGAVKSFKLISGEEIVAEVTGQGGMLTEGSQPTSYTVKRPHILQFQPVGPGQLGLAFVPWTLSNPTIQSLEIPASALIIPPFDPSANVEKQYLQQTSGIQLAGGMGDM